MCSFPSKYRFFLDTLTVLWEPGKEWNFLSEVFEMLLFDKNFQNFLKRRGKIENGTNYDLSYKNLTKFVFLHSYLLLSKVISGNCFCKKPEGIFDVKVLGFYLHTTFRIVYELEYSHSQNILYFLTY